MLASVFVTLVAGDFDRRPAVDAVSISGAGPDRSAMSGFGLTIWRADLRIVWLAICRDEFGGDFQNFSGVSVVLVQIEARVDGSPDGVHAPLFPCKRAPTVQ